MKQPYLGKKISERRKAKGLTQTELVEKCNITVRTLQRIESGEVTPRSYTVKAIFEVLDYNFYDSQKNESNKFGEFMGSSSKKLEQVYKYIIELFYLKTNTMKKLTILSIPVILICIVFLTISHDANAQRRIQKKLIGTWQVCNADSTVETELYGRNEMLRYKVITKETFMLCDITTSNKQIQGTFLGTYTVKDNVYTEFIQFTNIQFGNLLGVENSFKIEVKKDLMFIKGTNNKLNEIWKK